LYSSYSNNVMMGTENYCLFLQWTHGKNVPPNAKKVIPH